LGPNPRYSIFFFDLSVFNPLEEVLTCGTPADVLGSGFSSLDTCFTLLSKNFRSLDATVLGGLPFSSAQVPPRLHFFASAFFLISASCFGQLVF